MITHIPNKDVKLVIVGRNDFTDNQQILERIVAENGLERHVLFTGVVPRSEIPSWYARCEMFVNASVWEGFLIPEAFALRKPIVAYAVDAHEEVLGNDRGLLVKDATPLGFALAVKSLLDNPARAERLGENGYQWARENLDYDKITDNWEKIVLKGEVK
jgi:glycosyltransferase involved in cell wall biosynthesis